MIPTRYYLIALLLFFSSCTKKVSETTATTAAVQHESNEKMKWWKEAVVYQLYPFSFKDSDGDGVGDLKGIISKLDYLGSLGIDVIWLNPIYESPNEDNGYDISDYRKIMDKFGTMNDFTYLLDELHRRKIRLVMDLVVNHTSSKHEWFQKSRQSRDNAYRNYYHWWPGENGKPSYRWSWFDPEGAWAYDSLTNSYYLHYFAPSQPDLNWEHQPVRAEIFDMMKFWFDKGVDGFRMDVIPFISKDTTFPAIPQEHKLVPKMYYAQGPHLHQYLKEMHEQVLSKYDVMTIGEGDGVNIKDALRFVADSSKELSMFFHFETMFLDREPAALFKHKKDWSLTAFKKIMGKWDSVFRTDGWGTVFLGNHDFPRMVSRWGSDAPQHRRNSSKMLLTFLLTMRGTPFIFNGDEIGMTNAGFDNIEDYRDIMAIAAYKAIDKQKAATSDFIQNLKVTGRDNARTPFQWDESPNAGFTSGKPWISTNKNYSEINVKQEEVLPDSLSVLKYFRRLAQLRKTHPELIYGDYSLLNPVDETVYAYTRVLGDSKLLVVLNFSDMKQTYEVPSDFALTSVVFTNEQGVHKKSGNRLIDLIPYGAWIYKIK